MVTDPTELRRLARYAEDNGGHSKANMLRHYAEQVELYRPVVQAIVEEETRGEYDRERIEQNIKDTV